MQNMTPHSHSFGTTSITLSFVTGGQILTISRPTDASSSRHWRSLRPIPPYFIMLMSMREPQTEALVGGRTISTIRIFDRPWTRAGMVFLRIVRQAWSGQSWRTWRRMYRRAPGLLAASLKTYEEIDKEVPFTGCSSLKKSYGRISTFSVTTAPLTVSGRSSRTIFPFSWGHCERISRSR